MDDKKGSEILTTRVDIGLVDGLLVDMRLVDEGDRGHGHHLVCAG